MRLYPAYFIHFLLRAHRVPHSRAEMAKVLFAVCLTQLKG